MHAKEIERFSDNIWDFLVERVALFLHYDHEMSMSVYHNQLFKLAAAMPFLAMADNPMRYAMQNLVTIIMMSSAGVAKDIFLHNQCDDEEVFNRLRLLFHSNVGQESIQRRALALLAIVMINDYCTDQQEDMGNEKYNPVTAAVWDPSVEKSKLVEYIQSTHCPDVDVIFPLETALNRGFWLI